MHIKIASKTRHFLKKSLVDDDVLWNNEIESNRLLERIMYFSAAIMLVTPILNYLGVYHITNVPWLHLLTVVNTILLVAPALLCRKFKGERRWLKLVMLMALVIAYAGTDCFLTYRVGLLMAIPTILSARYYNRDFTIFIQIITTLLFGFSASLGVYMGMIDLNYIQVPAGTTLSIPTTLYMAVADLGMNLAEQEKAIIFRSFMPKYFLYVLVAIISSAIALRGRQMILEQAEVSARNARIDSELSLATDIQANMLPRIFPIFPERKEFDIYASMNPAKEVGGDFYDIFMVDNRHLAMVIADVSGKGVPAALFMVIAKTLIKDHAQMHLEPSDVFTQVNNILCESNEAGLFVTAWMGILDTETGVLRYVNAGHNPPLLRHNGNDFSYLKMKAGFVLAGMEGFPYHHAELQLQPGDKLFLYTDGVTEAQNSTNALYGEQRLADYLNQHINSDVESILHGVRNDIDSFVAGAEQFDDITMMCMAYYGPQEKETEAPHE